MWAIAGKWILVGAASLAGSAILRGFTRFVMFYCLSYYGDVLSGNSGTADLVASILHPQARITEMTNLAFGPAGIVSWGNFIIWMTDGLTVFRYVVTAIFSWWIVKQWVSVAPTTK